jgi:polyisoprenoid-binding protein YceI
MSSAPTPVTRSRRTLLVLVVVVATGLALAAIGGFVYFFGQSVPAAVSLATASPAGATPVAASAGSGSASLGGTWSVDPTIGSLSDFTDSFVGYRVDEQLVNVGATTAVGRTPKVSGSLTVSGTTITAATITADQPALQSDRSRRDGQLRTQAIQTDRYPTATFVLAAPIQLDHLPAEGETVSATAVGDLTLHGVTTRVSIPIQAKLSNEVVMVVGSLPIAFADYSITPPQSMLVLSVADGGTMGLQLHFTKG